MLSRVTISWTTTKQFTIIVTIPCDAGTLLYNETYFEKSGTSGLFTLKA